MDAARLARLGVIADEVAKLETDANERQKSIDGKVSFLAVAAGVLIGAQVQLDLGLPWWLVTLPLLFSSLALGAAAAAFLPAKRSGLAPKTLWLAYSWSTKSANEASEEILKANIDALTYRESQLRGRARLLSAGYVALALSVVALVALFSVNLAIG